MASVGAKMENYKIIDRGRGPELAGTRITVFDIVPYWRAGDSATYIATLLRLGTAQVEALIEYIKDHEEEVMAINQRIEERIARGNPPEIEEKLAKSPYHAIIQEKLEELLQEIKEEENGEGACG
jgi:uncharacterized protein (DUF433 family)